ncbi:MAG TPA: PPC domain-containing protein, partial [Rubricoccaceae bacterium]
MRAFVLSVALAGLFAACSSSPEGPVTETGELADGDETLATGEFQDVYTVRAREGQSVRVRLQSADFDPYLLVRLDDSGLAEPVPLTQWENDDAGGDRTRSEVTFRAPAAGEYEISVTSFAVGETGAYALVYDVLDAAPTDREPGGAPTDPPPAAGSEGAKRDPGVAPGAVPAPGAPGGIVDEPGNP